MSGMRRREFITLLGGAAAAWPIAAWAQQPERIWRILQVTGETVVCDRNATPASFAAQVAAATPGQTICLASGNYGIWTGTNKAITIRPAPGAHPVMGLYLNNGAANFTIDGGHTEIQASTAGMVRQNSFTSPGLRLTGCGFFGTPGPQNITIKRCWFGPENFSGGGYVEIDGPTNSNNVFDCCWFTQLNGGEAAIRIEDDTIIIKNCYFHNFSADGVKLNSGSRVTVQDCEFHNINPHGNSALHTDAIQWNGGHHCVIRRNYVHGFEQGVCAFDGTHDNIVEDNVLVAAPTPPAHWLSMYADSPGSTLNHNTIVDGPIRMPSRAGAPASRCFVRNNICTRLELGGDVVSGLPSENRNNMFRSGATGSNFNGVPIFVGGPNPTTWAGFKLASNSPGRNAGTYGLDVGIRVP